MCIKEKCAKCEAEFGAFETVCGGCGKKLLLQSHPIYSVIGISILLIPVALLIFASIFASSNPEDDKAEIKRRLEGNIIADAMTLVRFKLKDPDSAKFSSVKINWITKELAFVCGEVNGKNSFGGFVGFQRFISAGVADITFIDDQSAEFETAWKNYCFGAVQ